MSRLFLAACALALLPAAAVGDGLKPSISPGEAKPARSDLRPATFVTPAPVPATPWAHADLPPGYTYYGQRMQLQLWLDEHNCAPDGCPKPIGCGNFWTEKKFIFGSCRQFFGTAESTIGHGRRTIERPRP